LKIEQIALLPAEKHNRMGCHDE